jgi:uncharacterized protein YdhG (YjbR/CyaY superfamily)
MKKTARVKNTGEYIAGFPRPAQTALKRVRSAIKKALPGSTEVISYNIPAFKVNGRTVIYFAGWKEHYSIYPATKRLIAAFKDRLGPYEVSGKGTIRFPLSEPVPAQLIAGIAKFRAGEEPPRASARSAAGRKRS